MPGISDSETNHDLLSENGIHSVKPEPSVFFGNLRAESRKKLEKPRCFWNNRGRNNSSLLQLTEAFE
jgi:hypothetical protein